MRAFHNDPKVKEKYCERTLAHQKADEIIQGIGWDNGNGCAVGCTLENYDHKQYEVELGIPEWLAHLEDIIFEGLNKEHAVLWPARFLKAVNVGSDLDKIKTPFTIFILEENIKTLEGIKVDEKFKDVISAIEQTKTITNKIIDVHKSGNETLEVYLKSVDSFSIFESTAESPAESAAWSAMRSAVESAEWSAAESARSTAKLAWSAVRSVWSAAESRSIAKFVLESAESQRTAYWTAESVVCSIMSPEDTYKKYADKLIEMIEKCE
jgi:hypothetical protein